MNELIFGKDQTQRVVGVEPDGNGTCVIFVQNEDGTVERKTQPMSHWILYTEQLSPKMTPLSGNQPYKWLMEYESKARYEEVVKSSREKRYDFYNCKDVKEAFMLRFGVTYYKGLKVKDVSVLSFDLEHTYGIGDKLKKDGKLLLISTTYRSPKGEAIKQLFAYDQFESEADMIAAWCRFVRKVDPSIIIGHNVFGHDFEILRFAAKKTRVTLSLGRDGSPLRFDHRKSHKRKDGSQSYEFFNAHIYGREIVDTFFLAITYDVGRNYPNYKLKDIIKHERLEKPGRVYYDASKILTNYQDPAEWEKIKAYCIDDSDEALALFDLMSPSFFYLTQSVPRSFQQMINSATGGQLNSVMVRAYLQDGKSIAKASEAEAYEGATSFGIPGNYKNVFKLDIVSLYPSIIRQFEIYNREKDPERKFLQMMEYFTLERLRNKSLYEETKNLYYKNLSDSQKVFANSGYGFLGSSKLNYNYPQGAALITQYGREILNQGVLMATGKPVDEWKLLSHDSKDETQDE